MRTEMKLRRYLSLILVMVMMCTMVFSSCSNGNEGTTETTSAVTNESTETTETTETEETVVITDVMIGETIEAEYASDFSVSRVFSNDNIKQIHRGADFGLLLFFALF